MSLVYSISLCSSVLCHYVGSVHHLSLCCVCVMCATHYIVSFLHFIQSLPQLQWSMASFKYLYVSSVVVVCIAYYWL